MHFETTQNAAVCLANAQNNNCRTVDTAQNISVHNRGVMELGGGREKIQMWTILNRTGHWVHKRQTSHDLCREKTILETTQNNSGRWLLLSGTARSDTILFYIMFLIPGKRLRCERRKSCRAFWAFEETFGQIGNLDGLPGGSRYSDDCFSRWPLTKTIFASH